MPRNQIKIFPYFIISHTHKDKTPNVKIELAGESPNGILVNISVNLREHIGKCDDEAKVYFQAYSNRGRGLPNLLLGTFKELSEPKIGEYVEWKDRPCEDLSKEDARFKIIVCEEGKFKNSNVFRIIGQASIDDFFEPPQSGEKRLISYIRTKEEDIRQLFKVEMKPNEKPMLIFKKGSNIKQKIDNKTEVIQRTIIYTAIMREIITTYLIDTDFETCEIKDIFFERISQKIDKPVKQFPDSLIFHQHENKYKIDDQTKDFIEEAVACMVSDLKTTSNTNLIDEFIKANDDIESDIEDSEDLN